MATLDGFVRSGKVRYLGCSNFTASEIVEAQWATARNGGTTLISLQSQYSLVTRDIEAEILPVCARHGLGTLVWGPLSGGLLTGRYRRGVAPDPDSRIGRLLNSEVPHARRWARSQLSDRNFDIAEEVGKIASEVGTTATAVALAWVRGRPGMTVVIIGPRTVVQYEHNRAGLDLRLPDDVVARLDEISGPAPTRSPGRPPPHSP